jgi:hypothetical protein
MKAMMRIWPPQTGHNSGKHNRRSAHLRNDIGHRKSLTRTRHAQQGLKHLAISDAIDQLRNRRRLIARRRIGLKQLEWLARIAHKLAGFRFGNDFVDF